MFKHKLYEGDEIYQDFGDKGEYSSLLLCKFGLQSSLVELSTRENILG